MIRNSECSLITLPGYTIAAALNDRLEHEYRRWLRYQHPVCVTMIDIDHLKRSMNQQYGHLAGDKILKIIARTIRQQLEPIPTLSAASVTTSLCSSCPMMTERGRAQQVPCGKIRETIAQLPFRFRDQRCLLSRVSIGATLFDEQ